MKHCYKEKIFRSDASRLISKCNEIIAGYRDQGFVLTLRQLYYQLVARNVIKNCEKEYGHIGRIVNEARLAGLIDWMAIEDRTRFLRGQEHWDSPADLIEEYANEFRRDVWAQQTYHPEVWLEKDALIGVIENVCNEWDVPYFSCRGYSSQSEMWVAAQRLKEYADDGQKPLILYFGDHDPSGKDMTRDIQERLELFMGEDVAEVKRLALNMDQIRQYNPPPNPTKIKDRRAAKYIAEFGVDSWELDSMEPRLLANLIRAEIEQVLDRESWDEVMAKDKKDRARLLTLAAGWKEIE